MKRLISLILCFAVVFGMIYTDVYSKDAVNKDFNDALKVLNMLDMISDADMDNVDANTKVSRAQFAEYIVRILGLDYNDTEVIFADVKETHWAYTYIATLVENNLISAQSRYFRPEDTITVNEAAKILVTLTGYKYYAEANGGYPYGYSYIAGQLNIIPRSAGTELKFDDFAVMLINALNCEICQVDSVSNEKFSFNNESGKTLLSIYKNIYRVNRGKVTNIYGINLSNKMLSNNQIEINNVVYTTSDYLNAYDYLGKYLTTYYYKEDAGSEEYGSILLTYDCYDDNSIEITADEFDDYVDGTITYTSEAETSRHSEKINSGSVYIYNNSLVTTQVSTLFDDFIKGTIILRDTDRNGEYDLVLIKSYETYVASYYDSNNKTIYASYGPASSVDLNPFKNVIIKSKLGNPVTPKSIIKDSLLMVAKPKDESTIEIIVISDRITGTIDEINASEKSIIVNGAEYNFDDEYFNSVAKLVLIGNEYSFITDSFGNIGFIKANNINDYIYGYLVKFGQTAGLDKKLQIKMFNENDEFIILNCAASITVDGIPYKDALDVLKAFPGTTGTDFENLYVKNQIFRYSLNSNGEINRIDTLNLSSEETVNNSLVCVVTGDDGSTQHANVSRRKLGLKTPMLTTTKLMVVPTDVYVADSEKAQYLLTTGMSQFLHDYYYTIWSYKSNINDDYPDIVLYKKDISIDADQCDMMLVTKISRSLSDDGEDLRRIYGLQLGKEAYCDVRPEASINGISQGDVIRYALDYDRKAYNIELLYDESVGGLPTWNGMIDGRNWYNSSSTYRQKFQLSFGYATYKGVNVLHWGYTMGKRDECYDILSFSIPIMVYDSSLPENKRVNVGTVNDILDYETVRNNCSKLIFQTTNTAAKALIIYK